MVTMPLFAMLALAAFVAVRWGSVKAGPLLFGLLLGLTMASTSLGPPVLDQVTEFSRVLARTAAQVTGQG